MYAEDSKMNYITCINKKMINPATGKPDEKCISALMFSDICEAADYQYDEVVRLLADEGFAHDGYKYWTLQNYIDMANGLTVRNETFHIYS